MKKYTVLVLALSLILTLTACGGQKVKVPETETVPEKVGGWYKDPNLADDTIPEEAQAAFDLAMQDYTESTLTPISYLGTQVVAGRNFAFLCESVKSGPEPIAQKVIVVIYQDLNGNAQVRNISEYAE